MDKLFLIENNEQTKARNVSFDDFFTLSKFLKNDTKLNPHLRLVDTFVKRSFLHFLYFCVHFERLVSNLVKVKLSCHKSLTRISFCCALSIFEIPFILDYKSTRVLVEFKFLEANLGNCLYTVVNVDPRMSIKNVPKNDQNFASIYGT